MEKDYYSILGIDRNATQAEIKAAYRKLALKFHPDKNPDDPFFEQMFRDLKDAYETLSNPIRRELYNRGNQEQRTTSKPRRTQTEKHQQSPDQIINNILVNLRKMVNQTRGVSSNQVRTDVINEFLHKIFSQEILPVYSQISEEQKRDVIFLTIPLLKFLGDYQQNNFISQLVMIAGSDNELIAEIDRKFKSEKGSQTWVNTIDFIGRYWRLLGVAAVIIFLLIVSNSGSDDSYTPSTPRRVVVDDEPELNLPRRTIPSKWKGNQLNTGDSPYNHYFGRGVYNRDYENRIKIDNGQGTDVVVCLTQYYHPNKTIRNEYIRAGESFEMTSIPNGTYYLKSFYGKDWNPDTLIMGEILGFFETNTGFSKSDKRGDLLKIEQTQTQYSIYEITLYPVVGGNMQSEPINSTEFFE